MKRSLSSWVTFVVAVPLAPLLAAMLVYGSTDDVPFTVVLTGAQLLLIGIPLSAKSIGDVLPARKQFGDKVDALVGLTVTGIILATFYYAAVASGGLGGIKPNPDMVVRVSFVIYVCLVGLSFASYLALQKIADG